ncbi:MAG: substrate-binding domain-containing protein [Clostridiaceae bacterium]
MYISLPEFFCTSVFNEDKKVLDSKKEVHSKKHRRRSRYRKKAFNRQGVYIGISLPNQRDERWVRDKAAMEAYAADKGARTAAEFADNDAAKQEKQVEDLISKGVNVLIIAPVDSYSTQAIVEKAHNAGIKVIAYDRLINNSDVDLYVSYNNMRIGELQARYLIEAAPLGNYILLSGDPKDNNSKLLKDGAMEYLRPLVLNRDIKIVTDKEVVNWDPNVAYKIVEDSLKENKNNINAILAPNDGIAGASINALQTQGLAGKVPVTGQDAELAAVRRVVKGFQLITILKDTRELGKAAVESAIKFVRGQPVDVNGYVNNGKGEIPSILFTPVVVTADNVNEVLIYSGYLTKEQVYGT